MQADYLTNYEVGWKTTLLDGKLRFNGAVYQQEWKKFQFSFLGQNSFTEIHNGPDARIRGIEMDANLNLGALVLTAAGSYTDAKTRRNLCGYDDPTFTCTMPGVDGEINYIAAPAGTRLPVTPRFKINGTARYTVPVGSAKAYIQGVVAHQSSAASDIRTKVFIIPLNDATDPAVAADPASYFNAAAELGRLKPYTTGDIAIGAEFSRLLARSLRPEYLGRAWTALTLPAVRCLLSAALYRADRAADHRREGGGEVLIGLVAVRRVCRRTYPDAPASFTNSLQNCHAAPAK